MGRAEGSHRGLEKENFCWKRGVGRVQTQNWDLGGQERKREESRLVPGFGA